MYAWRRDSCWQEIQYSVCLRERRWSEKNDAFRVSILQVGNREIVNLLTILRAERHSTGNSFEVVCNLDRRYKIEIPRVIVFLMNDTFISISIVNMRLINIYGRRSYDMKLFSASYRKTVAFMIFADKPYISWWAGEGDHLISISRMRRNTPASYH